MKIKRKIFARDTVVLLQEAERIAIEEHDGHWVCMRFTTHWKCAFGTPNLDTGEGRRQLRDLVGYPSLRLALKALISQGNTFD